MEKKEKRHRRANVPIVYQMEVTECGAASLSMVLQYYGIYIPLEQTRVDTGVSRDGCKANKILQGAKKYGFKASGYKMSLDALLNTKPPCIIHWNFNHFLVYEGRRGKYVYLSDPAEGKRKITIEELDESFTGVVLKITPDGTKVSKKKDKSHLDIIKVRLKGNEKNILYLFLSGLFLVIPGTLIPMLFQFLIDEVVLSNNYGIVPLIITIMLILATVQMGFRFYRSIILIRLQTKMTLKTAYSFLHFMFQHPMSFFDQRFAGDLTERVESSNSIDEFLAGELATNILNIVIAFFYFIVLFQYSVPLTLIGAFFTIINFMIIRLTSKVVSRTITKVQQDRGKLIGVLYSGISIISTLKASGMENKYIGRVLGYYSKYMRGKQKNTKIQKILNVIPNILGQISSIVVLIIGATMVIKGNMTIGGLVAYQTLLTLFLDPISEITGFVERLQTMKADVMRVDDIYKYGSTESKIRLPILPLNQKLAGKITLKKITYGYSSLEAPLITDFHFELPTGRSIAFVGGSGSGKSTIAKLLSGLYRPWDGEVLFDDINIEQIPREIIATSVATVSQDISIFSGTIKENITMWNTAIRDEDIIRAAKDAMIHDVITQKPGAYEYHLEEGGRNLSGGQKQRLEIARALVLNPSILIMDEATSALDSLTEKTIIDNIKRRGCTCVIIAHRLSAIRDCEEILVIHRGEVLQRGNHEELIVQEGVYKELFG